MRHRADRRLLQGFSAGVELGGVAVYLAEMATPGRKGFYVSWQSASQQVAIMFAAMLGFLLNQWLAPAQPDAWGWRIPFFIGCSIIPFLFIIRRSLQETDEFGVAAVPALAMSKEEYPSLVSIPLTHPTVSRTPGTITRKGSKLAPPALLRKAAKNGFADATSAS